MRRAIYVGAGLDIMPILLFPEIKEFMYIDSLPFSSNGNVAYDAHMDRVFHLSRENRVMNSCSRPTFLTRLRQIAEQNNFAVIENTADYLTFRDKDDRILQYFYSCAFPEHLTPAIANKLGGADTLILAGHDPHNDVLEFMATPFHVVVDNNTYYKLDSTDPNYEISTFRELHNNLSLIGACHKYSGKQISYDCQNINAAKEFTTEQVNPADIFGDA